METAARGPGARQAIFRKFPITRAQAAGQWEQEGVLEGAWEGWEGQRAWPGFRKGLDWAGMCEECPSVSHSGVLLEPTAGWEPRAAG